MSSKALKSQETKKSKSSLRKKKNKQPPKKTINSLPNEIKFMIMENLGVYDKLSFSLTSKSHFKIVNSRPILRNDKIMKISPVNYDKLFTLLNSKLNIEKEEEPSKTVKADWVTALPNIIFTDCKNIICNDTFWNIYGLYVITIKFINCVFADNMVLKEILKYCPNIEEFEISPNDCCEALINCSTLKLPKLKKIENTFLSDLSLDNFLKNSTRLKCFDCKGIDNSTETVTNRDCYEASRLGLTKFKVKNTLLSDLSLNTFMRNSTNLKRFDCTETVTNNGNLPELSPIHLTSKYLQTLPLNDNLELNGTKLQVSQVRTLCYLKPFGFKLLKLTMSGNGHHFDVEVFKLLSDSYGDILEYLDISCFKCVTYGTNNFIPFKNLHTLKLPDKVQYQHLLGISLLENLENLHLGLNDFTIEKNQVLMHAAPPGGLFNEIIEPFKKLRRLFVTSEKLDMYSFLRNTSAQLIELDLRKCRLSTEFFKYLSTNQAKLEKLIIMNCDVHFKVKAIRRRGLPNLYSSIPLEKISSLKHLKYLHLTDFALSKEDIKNYFKWDELTSLCIPKNEDITNSSLLYLRRNCPAIVSLDLSGCIKINDKGVTYLTKFARLRKINLMMTRVKEPGIMKLIKSLCPLTECLVDSDVLLSNPHLNEMLEEKYSLGY